MKHIQTFLFILFLLSSETMHSYGQPQKIVIFLESDSTEIRYRPLDGKHLPHHDLYSSFNAGQKRTVTLDLTCDKTIYKINAGQKAFKVYAMNGCTDTVHLHHDSLSFYGNNKLYNIYLYKVEKSDQYCHNYSRTRQHPLSTISNLTEFYSAIIPLKDKDSKLLTQDKFNNEFIQLQKSETDLRYKALFLKKMKSLYRSPEAIEVWKKEFSKLNFHLTNEMARQSEWFYETLNDYVCIKKFIIEGISPQKTADSINTFLFNNYCQAITGTNLEYALAYLLYEDIYQKEYSKDIPTLYAQFIAQYPHSPYKDILSAHIAQVEALYAQKHDNSQIRMLSYNTPPKTFADIIQPFKGKIIYIDIWATTCAPCIQTFQEMSKKKHSFPHSDEIVFLYLSIDRDERDEKWKQLIYYYQLEGYHYRANRNTASIIYKTFCNSQGILSIPRYVIINSKGEIAFDNAAPFSDIPLIIKQLQSLTR